MTENKRFQNKFFVYSGNYFPVCIYAFNALGDFWPKNFYLFLIFDVFVNINTEIFDFRFWNYLFVSNF